MPTPAQWKQLISAIITALDSITTPRTLTAGEKEAILQGIIQGMIARSDWKFEP